MANSLNTMRLSAVARMEVCDDISLTVSPLSNAAGKVTGVSKIARDVSMRKKAEHERALALQDEERQRIANELHNRPHSVWWQSAST